MKRADSQVRPALYARVSSDQQAEGGTIASQVAALEERIDHDGLTLEPELRFLDEGYSGTTLVRPALERLRDLAAAGAIDRLYVHAPDRLARKYADQVLLVDELHRCGVELIFLNRALGQTPEDDLLLQVQGMVAEYERAKILERSRRGKRHAASRGSINVLSGAPYGFQGTSGNYPLATTLPLAGLRTLLTTAAHTFCARRRRFVLLQGWFTGIRFRRCRRCPTAVPLRAGRRLGCGLARRWFDHGHAQLFRLFPE
jgi:DNA invertase Pin-like site-specific DNA recombinase